MFGIYWAQVGPIDDAIKEIENEIRKGYEEQGIYYVMPVQLMLRYNELKKLKREKEKEVGAYMKKSSLYGRELMKKILSKKEES